MDIDKTVEFVTMEVIKRLQELNSSNTVSSRGRILVLDSLDNICIASFISKLKDLDYEAEGIEAFNPKLDISEYKFLIAPVLENRELSNISLGVSCGMVSEMIINGLLQGKKIFILEEGIEYRQYVKTCNKQFYSKLLEHENNLRSYGIEILKERELLKVLEDNYRAIPKTDVKCLDAEKGSCNNIPLIDKKILTEKDMIKLFKEGNCRIFIKRRSIITPLAMDYIRLNDIEIIRTE